MHKIKQWLSEPEPAFQIYPGTSDLHCGNTCHVLTAYAFFTEELYDMLVSYTIRQEQDNSSNTAPLIEESLQQILDVSEEISSLEFLSGPFSKIPIN